MVLVAGYAGTVYANTGKVLLGICCWLTDYTMSGIESSTCLWAASFPGENDQQYALYGNAGSGQLYHNSGTTSVDGFVTGDVIVMLPWIWTVATSISIKMALL